MPVASRPSSSRARRPAVAALVDATGDATRSGPDRRLAAGRGDRGRAAPGDRGVDLADRTARRAGTSRSTSQARRTATRCAAGLAAVRADRIVYLRAGVQPESGFVEAALATLEIEHGAALVCGLPVRDSDGADSGAPRRRLHRASHDAAGAARRRPRAPGWRADPPNGAAPATCGWPAGPSSTPSARSTSASISPSSGSTWPGGSGSAGERSLLDPRLPVTDRVGRRPAATAHGARGGAGRGRCAVHDLPQPRRRQPRPPHCRPRSRSARSALPPDSVWNDPDIAPDAGVRAFTAAAARARARSGSTARPIGAAPTPSCSHVLAGDRPGHWSDDAPDRDCCGPTERHRSSGPRRAPPGPGAVRRRLRVVVATADSSRRSMAGPAIRAWHVAQELAGDHEVRLVSLTKAELTDPAFSVEVVRQPGRQRPRRLVRRVRVPGLGHGRARELPALRQGLRGRHLRPDPPRAARAGPRRRRAHPAAGGARRHRGAQRAAAAGRLLPVRQRPSSATSGSGTSRRSGRVNPATYDADPGCDSLIDVVPFGISDEPPDAHRTRHQGVIPGIGADDAVILWGGGVYNWFDPLTLIRAVDQLRERRPDVRLVFLGMRHPNPTSPRCAWRSRPGAWPTSSGSPACTCSSTRSGCPTTIDRTSCSTPMSPSPRTSTTSRPTTRSAPGCSTTCGPRSRRSPPTATRWPT